MSDQNLAGALAPVFPVRRTSEVLKVGFSGRGFVPTVVPGPTVAPGSSPEVGRASATETKGPPLPSLPPPLPDERGRHEDDERRVPCKNTGRVTGLYPSDNKKKTKLKTKVG